MTGEVRTQGTEIFVLDSAGSPTQVLKIGNVSDIGDFGPQADDIETTNLDSTAKEYLTGLPDNGEATLQINQNFQNASHALLESNAGNGERFIFMVCFADGSNDPTMTAGGADITPPAGRSWRKFTASVKSYRMKVAKNDAVRITCALRISGSIDIGNKA